MINICGLLREMPVSMRYSSGELVIMKHLSLLIAFLITAGSQVSAFDPADLQRLLDTNYCRTCDLSNVNLVNGYLKGVDLKGANLKGAKLHFAFLRYADLEGDALQGANLKGAKLHFADRKSVV